MRISPILPLLIALSGLLTACEHNVDSVAKLNEIPFGGTNDVNIAAMVANPADLARGRGVLTTGGKPADAAIERLEGERAKPLQNPGSSATSGGGAAGG
jgi:type IV pilus biogenesis protein CpaD/CtpE